MIDPHNQSDDFMSDLLTDLAEMPVIGKVVTQTRSSLDNDFIDDSIDDQIETEFEETLESIISSQDQPKQNQDIEQKFVFGTSYDNIQNLPDGYIEYQKKPEEIHLVFHNLYFQAPKQLVELLLFETCLLSAKFYPLTPTF